MLSLLVLSVAIGSDAFGSNATVFAQSGNSSTPPTLPNCGLNLGNPCGQPGYANLTSWGNAFATMIEQTAQFKALANGTTYHIDNSGSFGYSWGPTIPSEELVTFFSPNRLLTIEVWVITAPVIGTTTVNSSQIDYINSGLGNSSSTVSLGMDLPLSMNGSSYSGPAPSFTPIIVSMALGNETGFANVGGPSISSPLSKPIYSPYLTVLSFGVAPAVFLLVRRRSTLGEHTSPQTHQEGNAA